jgi:gliding motility associated protien GldN
MKSITITMGVVVCMAVSTTEAGAQTRPARKPPVPPAEQQSATPQPSSPYANLPGRVDTSNVDQEPAKGQRPDHFYGNNKPEDLPALEYEHVRWDDALYLQKVWREIDVREKMNQTFRYEGVDNNRSLLFINVLLQAVQKEGIAAFADDRFSIPVSPAEITDMTLGQLDTFMVMKKGSIDVPDSFVVTRPSFDPKVVTRYRIMEEWIFDREGSRLYSRILGIAPLKRHVTPLPDGKEREGFSVMFWVSYPDLRPILAKTTVYSPKNMGVSRMNWDELFQSRMFSSYITKSTIDNVSNKNIRQYIKDPKLALLEGDAIKEKIFNYEQDQWSY